MEENIELKRPGAHCPVIDVEGFIEKGKQFDLDITLPEDNRDVIFGTIKDAFKEPVKNAVVKLIQVERDKEGKKKRIPISHTFTDKNGEFVFGPLCPGKRYALDIWVNEVRHFKMEVKPKHESECLRAKGPEKCEDNKEEKYED